MPRGNRNKPKHASPRLHGVDEDQTGTIEISLMRPADVARFRLTHVGTASPKTVHESVGDRCSIGSHLSNDVVVPDPTVSRFHCEIWIDPRGAHIRDLGSRNGTIVDGTPVVEAWLRNGSLIKLGVGGELRFELGEETIPMNVSDAIQFGSMVGSSVVMRTTFALLERAAASDATVLLEGETGTGKDVAADAIHQASGRKDGPLVVVDCAATPPNLLESQLFGHERGAFTGADTRRIGAFEESSGGTIMLDEIGELPLELQPKLLRVLERREIRRVGSNTVHPIDVRVIAATNRELRTEVNEGRWRSDLYYRLAVVRIRMPALREHLEDLPQLAPHLFKTLGASDADVERRATEAFISHLQHAAWPGNVRELRNYLERCLVFDQTLPVTEMTTTQRRLQVDTQAPYEEARRKVIAEFERRYLEAQLKRARGNVSQAARKAGIGRVYFYKLLHRHGLK